MDKPMSFIVAVKHYFGQKPGQTVAEFMTEVRALSLEDKAYFTAALTAIGYTIIEPRTA